MLARHDCAPHAFLPHVPSPLSPRSANIYGVRSSTPSSFYMSGENAVSEGRKWVSEQPPVVGFTTKPKREVRRAKVPGQDELTKRRRALFLRKVGEGREERRWESRGEDVCFFLSAWSYYWADTDWRVDHAVGFHAAAEGVGSGAGA